MLADERVTAAQREAGLSQERFDEKLHAVEKPRWRRAVQHYLPELIYGANDGIVTTLAVVSSVAGAALSAQVILILGFANLFADGFSMGASNFLSSRSRPKAADRPGRKKAAQHGLVTYAGFVVAGMVPLLAYLLPWFEAQRFGFALGLALVALFVIGAGRAFFTDRGWLHAGVEMLLLGVFAAGVAYGVGALVAEFVGVGVLIAA